MVCFAPTGTVFDLFIIFYGQAGESFVSYRHTSFNKKKLLAKQLSPELSSAGAYFFSSLKYKMLLNI